jgi:hypothetical protein
MSTTVALGLGASTGLGVLLVVVALSGRRVLGSGSRPLRIPVDELLLRGALTGSGFATVLLATRWLVAAVLAGSLGALAPTWYRHRHRHRDELIDALATWTEQLRDTLAAASGLEQAIAATAAMPPARLAEPLVRLGARLDYDRLGPALRRFADDVDHPLADFVVAALLAAAEHDARDIGGLLGQLAETARADAALRTRVWVGRARLRTSVRVIAGVVVAFVAGLLAFNRSYLDAYDTVVGQLVLAGVLLTFVGSFVAMDRMGRLRLPARFLAQRDQAAPA